jgi:hypothetical protein
MALIPERIDNASRIPKARSRPGPTVQGCGRHHLPKLTGLLK